MPVFSIIIPVYKVEKYVKQCIESVLNQNYQDYEILVVDDCGGDNSIKIVEEYAKNDNRIKIFTHSKNRGLAAARNTALENATGQYIVCLDSDDWMEPNCLETIEAIFRIYKTTSVWFNARKYFENTHTFQDHSMYRQEEGYRTLTPDNIAAYADFTWIKAYTRESVVKYNIRWPEGLTFEDGEFYFKYFTYNPVTYVISECLINYRHREDSIVREADRGNVRMEDIYQVLINLKNFWTNIGMYEKYKGTMLKLIQNRIRMCYGLRYDKENIERSKALLNIMDFPKDFDSYNPNKKQETPKVSVVVPIYNVEHYIAQCMDSIINQTYTNLEILCIDDCGTDNSMSFIENYAKNDSRIKIIHHTHNKGLGAARNTGLKNANGKFIFFVDSDDWIDKECIKEVVEKLQETNLNFVMFKSNIWWEENKQLTHFWHRKYADMKEGPFVLNNNELASLPHYSWNKGYKKEFLIKNNIYWSEGVIYEDMEFFFKIFIASPNSYMIDKPFYVYRRRPNSIIDNNYKDLKNADDLYKVTISIKNYLEENNIMDKYYQSFLQLLSNNLRNYWEFPETEKKIKPLMLKCLNDINFQDSFKKYYVMEDV